MDYTPRPEEENPFIGGKYRNPDAEGFRGIYMPYWNYRAKVNGPFSIRGVSPREHYKGNTYHIYHYDMRSNTDYTLKGFSHDASMTFDDDLSESIAPFKKSWRGNTYLLLFGSSKLIFAWHERRNDDEATA